jgi:hypothetical protein
MIQLKIEDKDFEITTGNIQLSFGSHANIVLELINTTQVEEFFTKKYKLNQRFEISSKKFTAKGVLIKTLDIDFSLNKLVIDCRCEIFEQTDLSKLRQDAIDQLLDETFDNT